jgi:hypothetical protein
MPALSPEEKALLQAGLNLDDKNDLDCHVAEIQATRVLGKWSSNIGKGVSKGKDREKVCSPGSFFASMTDCKKLVRTLKATLGMMLLATQRWKQRGRQKQK